MDDLRDDEMLYDTDQSKGSSDQLEPTSDQMPEADPPTEAAKNGFGERIGSDDPSSTPESADDLESTDTSDEHDPLYDDTDEADDETSTPSF